jgi:SAM-dependent MidA family methyltransferase
MSPQAPNAVLATISDEIARLGPIRFDRFMELALYGTGGFYDRPRIGSEPVADFVTSPHVHPVFAQLVAEAIRGLHDAMGGPERFDLVEVGAGDGTLLRRLLPEIAELEPSVAAVERSPGARRALAGIDGVTVHGSMFPSSAPAIVLAHELLDNLPFRRIRTTDDGPRDVFVGLERDRLVEVLEPVADPADVGQLMAEPAGEAIVPVGGRSFVLEALAGPAPRALLAIDYGSDTGAGGPAHGYAEHRLVEDLLLAPGDNDITAGVDFGLLAAAVRSGGHLAFPTVTQSGALVALGLEDWLLTELERQGDQLNTGRGAAAVGTWGGRSRALLLADPAGLGRFRWFVAATAGVAEPAWLRRARGVDRSPADDSSSAHRDPGSALGDGPQPSSSR